MLDLLDYRRRVSDLYRNVRGASDPAAACSEFRRLRDDLFRTHPHSAIPPQQRADFPGIPYYSYDPAFHVLATLELDEETQTYEVDLGDDGHFVYRRIGKVRFEVPTGNGSLSVFWIQGYGGGVFLPFKDATAGKTTYGGGRYLYDTIKGADLGTVGDHLILDFNFAYHPSCHYDPRWVCPLSPPENTLPFPISVGESLLR
jgi:hypothetical protein